MNMRSLGALIVLNLVLLLAATLLVVTPRPAAAQGLGRAQYIMVSGEVAGRSGQQAIYVIELASSRVATVFFNSSNNTLEEVALYDMLPDLEARGGAAGGGR